MINVAVFASGNGSNFEKLVCETLNNKASYKVKLLIVDKDDILAIKKAENLNIKYYFVDPKKYQNKEAYENNIIKILLNNNIELIALAGYMRIVGPTLLKKYNQKIINLHPSYLPNYKGKDSIKKAFRDKTEFTGVTIHFVDDGIDTGKIIAQEKLTINEQWTLEKLETEIHKIEHKIYPKILNELCKNIEEK